MSKFCKVDRFDRSWLRRQAKRAAAGTVGLAVTGVAAAQVTLPDAGIDPEGHVTVMLAAVGAILAAALGAGLALWLGPYAISKIRKHMGR